MILQVNPDVTLFHSQVCFVSEQHGNILQIAIAISYLSVFWKLGIIIQFINNVPICYNCFASSMTIFFDCSYI